MIPKLVAAHTDAGSIRCDRCLLWEHVHPGSTPEETRATAAKSFWTTVVNGKKITDHCPDCTRKLRQEARKRGTR